MPVRLESFRGPELEPHLDELGRLRITVFREFPYLYEGTLEYERPYLQTYLNTPRSLVVLAFDDDRMVGATTCLPMADECAAFKKPFLENGIAVEQVCYFGESILLPEYRGQGVGKQFFSLREAHADSLPDIRYTAFCAVDRPSDHPLRPDNYRPLDDFWNRQGYVKRPDLQCVFHWKEIDELTESPKTLTFWVRERKS
ncbi:MAG: GNAT family N-acetyltransferase [Verrucomicrobiae bacterium]|nr:GNAT family N-acetyltransferase [Verrucomicrobiae bacterium]